MRSHCPKRRKVPAPRAAGAPERGCFLRKYAQTSNDMFLAVGSPRSTVDLAAGAVFH